VNVRRDDLSPSLNRKYSGPMKIRVKITTTRVSTTR